MITVSIQLVVSVGLCIVALSVALGVFLERLKVRQEKVQKMARMTEALYNQPKRVCGEFVWHDSRRNVSHRCALDEGHDGGVHRAINGMGRKISHASY